MNINSKAVHRSSQSSCSAFSAQAAKNLAKWGKQGLGKLGLAIAEETGELAQAILQYEDEGGDWERIRSEAIDLGALCIQVAYYMDNPPCAACDRGDYQLGHSDHCPQNNPISNRKAVSDESQNNSYVE